MPLVPYADWLSALESSVEQGSAQEVEAMRLNPALRLLPFYKAQSTAMTPDREAMGLVFISTDKTVQVSESLPRLDEERANMRLAAWKTSWLTHPGYTVLVAVAKIQICVRVSGPANRETRCLVRR